MATWEDTNLGSGSNADKNINLYLMVNIEEVLSNPNSLFHTTSDSSFSLSNENKENVLSYKYLLTSCNLLA